MKILTVGAFAALVLSCIALCQPQPTPAFEVASVKPSDPDSHISSVAWEGTGRLNVMNEPLRSLIMMAYDVRDFQLSGAPGWVESEHFDIVATTEHSKSAADAPDPQTMTDEQRTAIREQQREKLRALLAARFGLLAHHMKKDQPVYVLTVVRNGIKMKAAKPDEKNRIRGDRGGSDGFAVTMSMLADVLSNATGRQVLDKTGLTSKYDYALEWAPDIVTAGADAVPPRDNRPTIFTAVQEQLGLRLESARAPVDMIVIDHIERPSAN